MCPNLQRLNLRGNFKCLKHLQGLRAIVCTCENLESLSLSGISVSEVESYLLLWELLSSLKKLIHLAIDLCMVKLYDGCDDANKQKLITMFRGSRRLQAMEMECIRDCIECSSNTNVLFSYFPSLAYCKMLHFRYSGIAHAITNCHQLKYERSDSACEERLLPLFHLRQLHIVSLDSNLCDKLLEVLSAHGKLERVSLRVKSITFSGIINLIMNSPNLIYLYMYHLKSHFSMKLAGIMITKTE